MSSLDMSSASKNFNKTLDVCTPSPARVCFSSASRLHHMYGGLVSSMLKYWFLLGRECSIVVCEVRAQCHVSVALMIYTQL